MDPYAFLSLSMDAESSAAGLFSPGHPRASEARLGDSLVFLLLSMDAASGAA
ncbi:hypothetical protein [Prosthecochloris sp.]|uniref:hypothetical protein n=1 Tax=Prosthecochloris sp. TaxID=290513 RepID=UPI0025FB788C|nr:hypothetical protein [Prosthecochloris sp.]